MDEPRLSRLTEKQRECLRLVYAHHSSKEIAPRLGVEPGTVDQYIKAAMRTLGVSDRRAAARMLAEHEAGTGQPLVYQSSDIAEISEPGIMRPPTEGWREPALGGAMREERAAFDVAPPPWFREVRPPLPIWGSRPKDLGARQRLGWIFGVMLLIAFTFGVLLAGLEALTRLGRLIAS
jgi:DNA-binding CsgD family transcriptional regulator